MPSNKFDMSCRFKATPCNEKPLSRCVYIQIYRAVGYGVFFCLPGRLEAGMGFLPVRIGFGGLL